MKKYPENILANGRAVAWFGLKNTLRLLYGYTFGFILYVLFRSSVQVAATLSLEEGLLATLLLNHFSVLFACLTLATTVAIIPAGIGIGTALLIAWLLDKLRPQSLIRIHLTGVLGAFMISIPFHLLLYYFLNFSIFTQPAATYFFWLGIPAIIHLGAGYAWGKQLSGYASKGKHQIAPSFRPYPVGQPKA